MLNDFDKEFLRSLGVKPEANVSPRRRRVAAKVRTELFCANCGHAPHPSTGPKTDSKCRAGRHDEECSCRNYTPAKNHPKWQNGNFDIYVTAIRRGCAPFWADGMFGPAWHCGCDDNAHGIDQQCSDISLESARKGLTLR